MAVATKRKRANRRVKKSKPPKQPHGGQGKKSVEEHLENGTFRRDRHGEAIDRPLDLQKPVLKRLPTKRESQRWVRNASDEYALANGCRFSERLAEYTAEWFRKYLRLSEGSLWAGKPFELLDWERDEVIYPLFGWVRVHPDHKRICRRIQIVYVLVPKKNGKSPLAAAVGTHLWAGDGEERANIYSVATDKDQAAIVHTHAVRMVEDSFELLDRSKLNRTTRHMLFEPTRSVYSVISGVPSRTRGREGLNAHGLIIDELHAWEGRVLFDALEYAQETRLEPVKFMITTAGDDEDGVWAEQRDYARAVVRGEVKDTRFLGVLHEAPKDADWTDLKVWEDCNPSWNTLIMPSQAQAAIDAAKVTPSKINSLRRYRLNIACSTELIWFPDPEKWQACYEPFTLDDFEGLPVWLGMDVAKNIDMTALAMVAKHPEIPGAYRQHVWYWMPEETVKKRKHLADYERWRNDGWLEETEGDECDYSQVVARILWAQEHCKLQELLYDPWQATALTQGLEQDHNIVRVDFPQNITTYNEPSKEFERLVNGGNMKQNGNPITTWQMGHVTTRCDNNQNIRPVKRKKGDYRTVDGVCAVIMALKRAILPEEETVYDTRGFITL